MQIIYEKDYITDVKVSGYRSYHIVVKYPVNMADGVKDILAEFQIRTLAMNFWATVEHSLNYKYKQQIPEGIKNKLKSAADAAFNLDQEMLEIKDEIMDAQKLFEVKSSLVSDIMNNVFTLISIGRNTEADNYRIQLNKLVSEGDAVELSKLLEATERSIRMYK
jgi:putative GTP pyrophosphokinase